VTMIIERTVTVASQTSNYLGMLVAQEDMASNVGWPTQYGDCEVGRPPGSGWSRPRICRAKVALKSSTCLSMDAHLGNFGHVRTLRLCLLSSDATLV
jgi:hypothetical protein